MRKDKNIVPQNEFYYIYFKKVKEHYWLFVNILKILIPLSMAMMHLYGIFYIVVSAFCSDFNENRNSLITYKL